MRRELERGERDLTGTWTRRRLLTQGAAVSAGLGALVAVGCGGDDSDDESPAETPQGGSTPSSTQEGEPVAGGTLRKALTSDPASFDLHSEISTTVVQAVQPVFNGLLTSDPAQSGGILPDLAEAIPESPDGATFIFKLRQGITFHDGSPLTVEDIVANYEWMMSPPSGATSSRQKILSVIDRIETPDESTITFTLKQPSASFLVNQSVPYVAIGRKSQLVAEGNLKQNPVGTGPFIFDKYEPGSVIELKRNPNYFKEGRPYLDGITLPILKDRKTLLENYYQGRLDLYLAQPDELPEIQSRLGDKIVTHIAPSNQRNHVFMNTSRKPFDDIRVRRALSIGIDRTAARDVMGGGEGTILSSYMHPEGAWGLSESELRAIDGYTENADVEAAKRLLEEAGVPEGMEVTLLYRTLFEATGVFMVDQLTKLGFTVNPVSLDGAAIAEAANSGNFDIFIWTASPALDDPDAVMGDIGVSTAPRNWSRIVVPEADTAFEKQTAEFDADRRKQLVNEADRALMEAFASIVLNFDAYRYTYYPKVRNKSFVLTDIYVNQRFEDVWLAQG